MRSYEKSNANGMHFEKVDYSTKHRPQANEEKLYP